MKAAPVSAMTWESSQTFGIFKLFKTQKPRLIGFCSEWSKMQKAYEEQAIIARKHLQVFITELNKFTNKPNIDKKQFKAIFARAINSLIKTSDGLLRLAAKPTVFIKQEVDYKDAKYDFEHRPPISLYTRYLASSMYNNDIDLLSALYLNRLKILTYNLYRANR